MISWGYDWERDRRQGTIADLAAAELDGSDHERGQLEAAVATADNAVAALGRLLEHLEARNLISLEEVAFTVLGYCGTVEHVGRV